jgi:hypothetical protein
VNAPALERVIRRAGTRRRDTAEQCELCGETVAEQHRHLLDTDTGAVLCTCRACSLLFHRDAASNGHYRLLPDRRLRLGAVDPGLLGVPVGLAFFVRQEDGALQAHYPSPAGATRWEVEPATWAAMVARCPDLGSLAPRTQALLLNTARGRSEHWLVPLDDCYRLVAVIRQEWRGLSGGSTVWPAVDRFFEELTPVP